MLASVIGLRANATAIDVPSSIVSVCSAASTQREERIVRGLGRPDAGVAGGLRLLGVARRAWQVDIRCLRRPSWRDRNAPVAGAANAASPGERAGQSWLAEEALDLGGEFVARAHLQRRSRERPGHVARRRGVVDLLELARPSRRCSSLLATSWSSRRRWIRPRRAARRRRPRCRWPRAARRAGPPTPPDTTSPRRSAAPAPRSRATGCRGRAARARARPPCRRARRSSCGRNGSVAAASWRRRCDREPRRPGVRRGERVGAEADHLRDTELRRPARRRRDEAVPRHVGLGAGQQQHVATVRGRGRARNLMRRHVSRELTPSRSSIVGPAGAEVDEHVVVELGDRGRWRTLPRGSSIAAAAPRRRHRSSR